MILWVRDVPGFQWILPESQTSRLSPEQMGAQLRDCFACLQYGTIVYNHTSSLFLNPATMEEDLVSCQLPASLAYCSTDLKHLWVVTNELSPGASATPSRDLMHVTCTDLTSSHGAVLCRWGTVHKYFPTRV
ncbi:hypothetical protein QR685DRAFT_581784 [Neurospora intermedia]|uniref:Uncharacterized protein n=1 Tax=Neurospora intermedia TaxID=5142 RepID=A0ABR3CZ76_NEUIN